MNELKWAYSDKANLEEPLEGLKEKGWQYADIPTAGNFNWLFNQLSKQISIATGLLLELINKTSLLEEQIKQLDETIKILPVLKENIVELQETSTRIFNSAGISSDHQKAVLRALPFIIETLNTLKDSKLNANYPFNRKDRFKFEPPFLELDWKHIVHEKKPGSQPCCGTSHGNYDCRISDPKLFESLVAATPEKAD